MLQTRYLLICILNMACVYIAHAQHTGIRGKITDVQNNPLPSASVSLLYGPGSGVLKLAITNKQGVFTFDDIKPGIYLIRVTLVGYKSFTAGCYCLKSGISLNVGDIFLSRSENMLTEVTVSNDKEFTQVSSTLITLNVRDHILSSGSTAMDILKRAPGIQVDNNDNISLNGRSDVLVMIDDKPTYLPGQVLAEFLRSIQGSMIDKVELVSNPNSTFEAAGTGGVINIRLKKDRAAGNNVQLTSGIGLYQPAGIHASEIKGNAGVNFNHHHGSLNIFGGYTFSDAPVDRSSSSGRLVSYNGRVDQIDVDWFTQQRRQTNTYRLGVDYNIKPKHIVGFLINGFTSNSSVYKNTSSVISTQNSIDSTLLTYSTQNRNLSNLMVNVSYRGDFARCGQLTIDADYSNYVRHSTELINSDYVKPDQTSPYRLITLQNISPSNFNLYTLNASYQVNINTEDKISAGIKHSYVKTDNISNFGQLINNVYHTDSLFTNQFRYSEHLSAAYVDYQHMFGKKLTIEMGARMEQTQSDGLSPDERQNVSSNYVDIFPNIQLNRTFNADHQLIFTYSRRITRPRYEDLNPFLSYMDQYTYQIGTPYLRPFYSNTFELSHVYKEKLTTILSFAVINRFTQVVYTQNDQSQIITLSKINLGDRYNYGVHLIAPSVSFNKWYLVDLDLSVLYQHFSNISSGGSLDSGSPDIILKTTHDIKLPGNFKLELFGLYETATTFGIFRYKANYYFNAGISKNILKKRGSVSLRVDDILNSDKNIYTSHYQNLDIGGNQKNSFRLIQLSFSFAFGSQTIKAMRKRSTGDEDEQGRAGQN